jgi:cytochrome c-type biogenesis protein CcmH
VKRRPVRLRLARTTAALLALALLAPASSLGQGELQPSASLPDIEDEVMCPICGTMLSLSEAPQAERQRAFIRELIAEGRSKEEIKDALVDEYGPTVLAVPGTEGFDLAAWVVPGAGLLIAAAALGIGIRRWRREPAPTADPELADSPAPEDERRLKTDLGRYEL